MKVPPKRNGPPCLICYKAPNLNSRDSNNTKYICIFSDFYVKVFILSFSLQQICILLEQCVESICVSGSKVHYEPNTFDESNNIRLEMKQLIKACRNAFKISEQITEEAVTSTITHRVSFKIEIKL